MPAQWRTVVLLFSLVFISALVAALTKSEGRTAEEESSSFVTDERAAFEQLRRIQESLALAPIHPIPSQALLGLTDIIRVVKNLHTGWENHGTGTWSRELQQNARSDSRDQHFEAAQRDNHPRRRWRPDS